MWCVIRRCLLDGRRTDVLYNKFNVDSSSPRDSPTNYMCVVATSSQWQLSRCSQQHPVVFHSDHLLPGTTAFFISDNEDMRCLGLWLVGLFVSIQDYSIIKWHNKQCWFDLISEVSWIQVQDILANVTHTVDAPLLRSHFRLSLRPSVCLSVCRLSVRPSVCLPVCNALELRANRGLLCRIHTVFRKKHPLSFFS